MNEKPKKDIDSKIFIKKIYIIMIFVLWLIFLYKISNIIIILFLSLFLNILFSPFLNRLNKYKINDFFWIIILFISLMLILTLVIFLIVPLIINQGVLLFNSIATDINWLLDIYYTSWIKWFWLPTIVESYINDLNIEQILNLIQQYSVQISGFLWNNIKNVIISWVWIIWSFTSSMFNLVLIFLFTFFIALERKYIRKTFYALLPKKISHYFYKNEKWVIEVLSVWLKWQLIVSAWMFTLTLTWLLILKLFWIHISWIFSLALIAWFMEFIPYLWTFFSFFIALSISLWTWLDAFIWILIVYLVIQQIEWNFMVPYIMWKTLALSPFVVLLSMTIWWALFWIVWVLFTIPVISIIKVLITPYIERREKENHFIK